MLTDVISEHFKDLSKTKIKSFVEPATIIDPLSTISHAINEITKNDVYDLYCLEGKSVLSTNVRALLAGKDISDMKIRPFLYPSRSLSINSTLQDAASIMSHHRTRSVPVVDQNKIVGVILSKTILNLLAKKDNKWIKANIIYSSNPVTICSNDSLATARKIMLSRKFDHLPVISNGNVKQVLTSFHILQTITPHENLRHGSAGVKKIRTLGFKIGNIGSNRIPQCTPNDNLNTVLGRMLDSDTTCILVTLNENLQGIITYRDILSLLSVKFDSEIPLYMVGMPDGQKNIDLITSKFSKTLKRLQKVYSDVQEARVSIKKQRSGGKKDGKYEVTVIISTPHHTPYVYREVGWDLSNVVETISQRLLRNLSKRSKRRYKTSIRMIER